MTEILLDADMLSEVVNRHDGLVVQRFWDRVVADGRVPVAAPALYEVIFGLHRVRAAPKLRRLRNLRPYLDVRPFGEDAADHAGPLAAGLERTGLSIGKIDPQIAAIALAEGRTLVTGNTRHFERVRTINPTLALENWRA